MEKSKKKRGAKIAAALVALTALTCCFVGTTFAKYTSTNEASAKVTVAHWQITNISKNGAEQDGGSLVNKFTFGTGKDETTKLSPSVTEGVSTNKVMTNSIKIENLSDVDAMITLDWKNYETDSTKDAIYTQYSWNSNKTNEDTLTLTSEATSGTKDTVTYKKLADDTLTWKCYYAEAATEPVESDAAWKEYKITDTSFTGIKLSAKTTAETKTLWIKIELTWTTANDQDGDLKDTELGMYLDALERTLTLTATQASQIPAAPATGA